MNHPSVGSTGRALTPLAPAGRVEVGGMIYRAETAMPGAGPRPPVPAGREVVVSGWRADAEFGVVLLVTDTLAPPADAPPSEPAPPPPPTLPPTTEERVDTLERESREARLRRRDDPPEPWPEGELPPPADIGWYLLTFGQLVSALGCFGAPVYALLVLGRSSPAAQRAADAARQAAETPNPTAWVLLQALLAFLYSAAMFVVFTRVKRLPA